MKNKILPLSLVTLVIFLGAFLISATITQPDIFAKYGSDFGDESARASEQYLAKLRNNQVTGALNPVDVIQARKQAEAISLQNASREDFEWQFLGPDNYGGRTRAILFDNTDETSATIIAGAVSGGLFKSTNAGQTWSKINGEESNLNVSCIAQATDGTIYVGTGEGFTIQDYSLFQDLNYNGAFVGTGIYKSTDGENFNLLESTAPLANTDTVPFAYVNKLAVNPVDNSVWAATNGGVFYSSDAGNSWNLARSGDTAFLVGLAHDVKIGSDGITAISLDGLAYISDAGHPNQFVLHSSDTFNLPYESVGRTEFAIAPSDPAIIYATVVNDLGGLINVYRSDDRGVHWRIIAPGGSSNLNFFSPDDNVNQGQGLYDNTLVVFPEDPDRILLGGIDMWEGRKINETGFFQWTQRSSSMIPFLSFLPGNHHTYVIRPGVNSQVYIGSDAGVAVGLVATEYYEFLSKNKTYNTGQFATVGYGGQYKRVLGGAQTNGTLYINGHGNWATAKNGTMIGPNNGGECFVSIIDPNLFIYTAVPGENFWRSEDEGQNFSNTFLSNSIQIPTDAYITPCLYWENFNNDLSRDSVDYAVTQEMASGTEVWVRSHNRGYPFKYTLPTVVNPGDTLRVKDPVASKFFIGTNNNIWMTQEVLDFGSQPEWFNIANKAESGFDGQAVAMGLSADANYIFVGTMEGELYRISNIKYAYDYERADVNSPYCIISTSYIPLIDPSTGEQNTQIITSVSVDPQDANNVIVTLGNYGNTNYIYKTSNGLDEVPDFTSIQGELPKMPVYTSLIEMSDQNVAMIGTDLGMYMTNNLNDATPSWTFVPGKLGTSPVFKIKQQLVAQPDVELRYWNGVDTISETFTGTQNFGVLYAATYGRGLYLSQKFEKPVGIFTPDEVTHKSALNIYPNPVSTYTNVEYTLSEPANVTITVYDINGRMMVNENISQTAGTHQYKVDCTSLPRGTYITTLQTGNSVETGKFIVVR